MPSGRTPPPRDLHLIPLIRDKARALVSRHPSVLATLFIQKGRVYAEIVLHPSDRAPGSRLGLFQAEGEHTGQQPRGVSPAELKLRPGRHCGNRPSLRIGFGYEEQPEPGQRHGGESQRVSFRSVNHRIRSRFGHGQQHGYSAAAETPSQRRIELQRKQQHSTITERELDLRAAPSRPFVLRGEKPVPTPRSSLVFLALWLILSGMDQKQLLREAVAEARKGLDEGGLPIGSVLADINGNIVARGHNLRVQSGDPTAHAEVVCIRQAGRRRDWNHLILVSTLSPCVMCTGTSLLFKIPTVIIGENSNFRGAEELFVRQGVQLINLDDPQCKELMRSFIEQHPDLWNEDIGF